MTGPVPFEVQRYREHSSCIRGFFANEVFCLSLSLLVMSSSSVFAGPERLESETLSRLTRYKITKSKTGRFTAMGPRALSNAEACSWAERILTGMERQLGVKSLLSRPDPMRMLLQTEMTEPGNEVAPITFDGPGKRFFIRDLSLIETAKGDEALCRALLALCLQESVRTRRTVPLRAKVRFPGWLPLGLSRYLNARTRAGDSRAVLDKWQRGKLALLKDVLSVDPAPGDSLAAAAQGMVVSWIVSMDNTKEVMDSAFDCLVSGGTLDADWMFFAVRGCASVVDLEEKWDTWILRQKRMVHIPGLAVRFEDYRMDAALLLYPGLFDIPLNDHPYSAIEWERLVERRKEPWIEGFCRKKSTDLRILTLGRNVQAREVIESYCKFLSVLQKGGSERKAGKLLEEARALQRKLNAEP